MLVRSTTSTSTKFADLKLHCLACVLLSWHRPRSCCWLWCCRCWVVAVVVLGWCVAGGVLGCVCLVLFGLWFARSAGRWPVGWLPVCGLIRSVVGRSVCGLLGRSVGSSVGRLLGQVFGRWFGLVCDRVFDHLFGRVSGSCVCVVFVLCVVSMMLACGSLFRLLL